ncbi:MAG: beta-N-acetylhexosaminidase [Candidatus Binatia bacterium]
MDGLREKLGQMIMVGCPGERIGLAERVIFEEYGFGGFILFKHNCGAPRQIHSLCRSLWNGAADQPPLIAIDQEGGAVHRLPHPFTHFPTAAEIGARQDADLAYRAGRASAAELALVGINLNFAPVLDVNSNPLSPIIGARAFGADPRSVSIMASAWARGLREGDVIPCGKHFPGHGGTDEDSHFALPVIDKSLAELQAVELPPFIDACRGGIEALMTAHVKFTALDPSHMATLSEPIITGLLRHQLGFDGVVFSDDMEMKAISDHYDAGAAAALALRAGVDMMLFCHDLAKAVAALEFLYGEAEHSPALRAQVEASQRRIGDLKQRWLKAFSGAADDAVEERLARLDHRRIVAEIHGSL